MKNPSVVVIGGGTGTFAVLSGLKNYPVSLSAVVTMMDSGGSTGLLRDQLGVLPPGDMRQALVALSEAEEIWRKLFIYRFDSGDLSGHNFGNLFLSALEKITGSTEKAISFATQLLQTKGEVLPITLESSTLCARYADGKVLEGEKLIDYTLEKRSRITSMYLSPNATINPRAKSKIEKADYIIFGPGDLYTSIIPNLLVDGTTEAIRKSKAKKIYIMNLVTKYGQTDGFVMSDFVNEMYKYTGGGCLDYVVVNSQTPDRVILDWYKQTEFAGPVKDDLNSLKDIKYRVIRSPLLNKTRFEQSVADRIKRSLIRHDPEKLAKTLMKIFWE